LRARLAPLADAARSTRSGTVQHALAQSGTVLHLGGRRRPDLVDERGRELRDAQGYGSFRLGYEIDGAQPQRLERGVGAVRRQRRNHDDGGGPLHHDAVETFESAHLGHVDVERDDLRLEALEPLQRLDAVASELDLEVGLLLEHAAEELAHEWRVVHDEHLDHASSPAF
jgi:hypothetical protein